MQAGIFNGKGKINVSEVNDPKIQNPTEAIVEVTYTCVCGSDLWFYRGIAERDEGSRIGHEFMGIVAEVGDDVKNVNVGDLVIAPFTAADGTCPECKAGMSSACRNKQAWGSDGFDGGQGQKTRVPLADGTLFTVPKDKATKELMPSLLALSDVLCTGHHAAISAGVSPGKTVAVIGDGAVGLCAVAAAKRLGAEKIILLSTHEDRAAIGTEFGASDIVNARGDDAVKQVKALTDDLGVDCFIESVGMQVAWETAFGAVRPGGNIGFVGAPYDPDLKAIELGDIFNTNVGIRGGMAPAATYIPELLPDVLSGKLDVSAIFSKTFPLADLQDAYAAMDERSVIKALIHPVN